jgi:hypothetical protein
MLVPLFQHVTRFFVLACGGLGYTSDRDGGGYYRKNPTSISVSHNYCINPLNAELNPIRHLLALVGARHFVHVSRIRG